jgi:hypothetical protein
MSERDIPVAINIQPYESIYDLLPVYEPVYESIYDLLLPPTPPIQNELLSLAPKETCQVNPEETCQVKPQEPCQVNPQEPCQVNPQEPFIPGRFDYIEGKHNREMLRNAYQAITLTENWGFIRRDIESFACSTEPEIIEISKKMLELGYDGHSGASFGYTMRAMQSIAIYGEKKFKEVNIENEKKNSQNKAYQERKKILQQLLSDDE